MNLESIISSETEVSLMVKASDLNRFAKTLISQTRAAIEAEVTEMSSEKLLTVSAVAEMLQVDRSTLFRWSQVDYLKPIEVGGKKRYRLSDVNRIIKPNR